MKRNKGKEAKFFCESCGSEVPGNAKVCPVCGKFFASVRCPKCGRTGTNDEFKNGCPTCGYAVDLTSYFLNNGSTDNSGTSNGKKSKKRKPKRKNPNIKGLFQDNTVNKSNDKMPESSLPVWVYIFTIVTFLVLVICLYSCL